MARFGLVIDYLYCTGCRICEIACQMENKLPVGQFGIKVQEIGPWQISEDRWELEYILVPTQQCNLCHDRIVAGKQPTCVQHCMSDCLRYGTVDELVEIMGDKYEQAIFIPKQ